MWTGGNKAGGHSRWVGVGKQRLEVINASYRKSLRTMVILESSIHIGSLVGLGQVMDILEC